VATAQAHVMEVSRGSGVCAALCIRRTLCRHVTIGTPIVIFAVWLSFGCIWRFVHCTNRQKHSKPFVYQSSQVYQDCTNSVPTVYESLKTVKNSQKTVKTAKMSIGVPIVTCLPRLYQQCANNIPIVKNSQKTENSKNDHWCTNRHMSNKTVPTVYRSSKTVKNSQKTVKTAKIRS